jgi:multiple sugar transport system permease protein
MSHARAVDTPSPPNQPTAPAVSPRRRSLNEQKKSRTGWLFVAPFALVFVAFLILPLVYAFYLSLYSKGLATGVVFAGVKNYATAFTDPSFLRGVWFVLRFAVVLIPVQMLVSLAVALVLDALTTHLARIARLMIFLPYAIPAVIGALMWGFLYSPTFGPMQQLANIFGANAPFLLGPDLVFFGLMNVVTWQWAGYYMIIIYAALQGIDSSIYEAARMDGANAWQIAFRIKVPMVSSAPCSSSPSRRSCGLCPTAPSRPTSRRTSTRSARPSRTPTSTTPRPSASRSGLSSSSPSMCSSSSLASAGASSHDHNKH